MSAPEDERLLPFNYNIDTVVDLKGKYREVPREQLDWHLDYLFF